MIRVTKLSLINKIIRTHFGLLGFFANHFFIDVKPPTLIVPSSIPVALKQFIVFRDSFLNELPIIITLVEFEYDSCF